MKRRALTAAIAAGLALAFAGAGTAMALTTPPPATISVGGTSGAALTSRYLGFSFPLSGLAAPTITTGTLPQLMKTLGPGSGPSSSSPPSTCSG